MENIMQHKKKTVSFEIDIEEIINRYPIIIEKEKMVLKSETVERAIVESRSDLKIIGAPESLIELFDKSVIDSIRRIIIIEFLKKAICLDTSLGNALMSLKIKDEKFEKPIKQIAKETEAYYRLEE